MKILIYILIDLIPLLAAAQEQNIPIIKSNTSSISIRDGNTFRPNSWTLAPEYKPDVYNSGLINGKSHKVTFYTDIDSIGFFVELGKEYDFIILHGNPVVMIFYSLNSLTNTVALCPPNPRELDMATLTSCLRASLGT